MRLLIRLYQLLVSPVLTSLGCQCRFYPSCSEYARQAFAQHSFLHAMTMTVRRVWRCRPGCDGGVDPVITN